MTPTPGHPLAADRNLDQRVRETIYMEIHAVLGWPRTEGSRALQGTGMSVDDIAAEAYAAVRMYDPDRLQRSWKALARAIARHKAVQALRAAGKGLSGTAHRREMRLISGDAEIADSDGEATTVFDALATDPDEFENETIDKINALDFYKLARDELNDRELAIYEYIIYHGLNYVETGDILGITGARVGQIFNDIMNRVTEHPDNPFRDDD